MGNYSTMTSEELKEHERQLKRALKDAGKNQKRMEIERDKQKRHECITQMDMVAQRYGFKSASVLLRKPKSKSKTPSAPLEPKYRHPETGQTWTGRGRRPSWVQEWMRI